MIAVIRIRGTVNISPDVRKTLDMLRLSKPNHLVVVKDEQEKMVNKVRDYVAFGKINEKTLAMVFEKRGRIEGNKRIPENFLKEKKIASYEELAKNYLAGKVKLGELGLEKVFRLTPPRKGHGRKGIKKPYALGGALGQMNDDINELIIRMI